MKKSYFIGVRGWMLNVGLGICLFPAASALAGVHYVDVSSTNATTPYTNWTTAATNIQDAVDAAAAGDEVMVTNGIYAVGTRTIDGVTTNRVAVDKPLRIWSVNGPQFTTIDGGASVRCMYLTNDASLSGFTLINGSARSGGGIYCASPTTWISNCVLSASLARYYNTRGGYYVEGAGGGACGGTLYNCTVAGNSAGFGGGASGCTLFNCTLTANSANVSFPPGVYVYFGEQIQAAGGGAEHCTLSDCTLSGNSVTAHDYLYYDRQTQTYAYGGGASDCTLNNCTLSGNSAASIDLVYAFAYGGAADHCTINNCVLTGNSVRADNSYFPNPGVRGGDVRAYGGGASDCTLNNCTLTGNSATATNIFGSADSGNGGAYGELNNCILFGNWNSVGSYGTPICNDCGSPGQLSGDNWYGDPSFVDTNRWANLRLRSNSPCINAGNNSFATNGTDLDGNPRIAGGTVDIGAYEFQSPVSMISYAWLQQFNLPINSSTDTADPDGDGVNNYHEWLAGTDPTNLFSSPAQLTIIPSGVPPSGIILTWPTNAVGFSLQSTTNLGSPIWSTNSPAPVVVNGQNTVTHPITGPQQFYRLVQ